jgi:hypothetical protein
LPMIATIVGSTACTMRTGLFRTALLPVAASGPDTLVSTFSQSLWQERTRPHWTRQGVDSGRMPRGTTALRNHICLPRLSRRTGNIITRIVANIASAIAQMTAAWPPGASPSSRFKFLSVSESTSPSKPCTELLGRTRRTDQNYTENQLLVHGGTRRNRCIFLCGAQGPPTSRRCQIKSST